MVSFDTINIGDALPELPIDVSAKLIVGGAIASRDYQDVHHDKARAIELGSKDIFMNILTTNGFVGRFVTDWTGPAARLRQVDIRLGAPTYPGDTMTHWTGPGGELKSVNIRLGVPNYVGDHMTLAGVVKDKRVEANENLIEIAVTGKNSLGNHVSGTVLVALYEGDAI